MAATILIIGGSGVFGRLLARELLATTGANVLISGRDFKKTREVCRQLGKRAFATAVNIHDVFAVRNLAATCSAVACTAGPFQSLPPELPGAVIAAGTHWLDVSDYRGWVLPILASEELHARAIAAGRVVAPGLSTVPTLSGVLAQWCAARLPGATHARITLFIGNRNSKGRAAIRSALDAGFDSPEPVEFPFGRSIAYRFDSPDADLLRADLGLDGELRVSFEWPLANRIMATGAALSRRLEDKNRQRLAKVLAVIAAPFSHLGSDRGCIQAEVWRPDGGYHAASFTGAGQRMAILPCALAIESLLDGTLTLRGVIRPGSWLAIEEWPARMEARGLVFGSRSTPRAR